MSDATDKARGVLKRAREFYGLMLPSGIATKLIDNHAAALDLIDAQDTAISDALLHGTVSEAWYNAKREFEGAIGE